MILTQLIQEMKYDLFSFKAKFKFKIEFNFGIEVWKPYSNNFNPTKTKTNTDEGKYASSQA